LRAGGLDDGQAAEQRGGCVMKCHRRPPVRSAL
jgi:hypothetical protein